jgi:archaellum component FlaG (FlaF/FlaG flagellin family)
MVWKNDGNEGINFSPRVSFEQQARYKKSEQDLWLNAQSIHLDPGSSSVSELILTKEISNHFVNVNVNHANNKTLILDKLQFVEQLKSKTNLCAITPINIKHCKTIVDFKHSEILSEITDQRFNSVFKDRYTGFTEQGVTIKTGNNPNYNYQGLSGTGFTLLAGDTIRMVWKNEGNNTIDFSPKVSFTQKARYKKSEQDLWLNGQSIQLNPGSTAVSELILTKEISNNFININVNHANNKTLVLDKLQFVEQLSPETNVCLLGDQIE